MKRPIRYLRKLYPALADGYQSSNSRLKMPGQFSGCSKLLVVAHDRPAASKLKIRRKLVGTYFMLLMFVALIPGPLNAQKKPIKGGIFLPSQPIIKTEKSSDAILVKYPFNISFPNVASPFIYADLIRKKIFGADYFSESPSSLWTARKNLDGTYSIYSMQDNRYKLTYRRPTNMGLPGYNDHQRSLSEFVVATDSEREEGFVYFDQYVVNPTGGFDYELKYDNNRSSVWVKIISTSVVSEASRISLNFNNLNGWEKAGAAFENQPSTRNLIPYYDGPVVPEMPLGGSYWKGIEDLHATNINTDNSYINTGRPGSNKWEAASEHTVGTMISLPFLQTGKRIMLKLGGTRDEANIRFELLQKLLTGPEDGAFRLADGYYYKVAKKVTGNGSEAAREIVIDEPIEKYNIYRIRIVDSSTTGYILVDNIRINVDAVTYRSELDLGNAVKFTQKPIWGAIDMHTHPFSFLGMGGKLMHGALDGDPAIELGNCNCTHGGWGINNTCGNYFRAEMVNMVDEHNKANHRRGELEHFQVPHNDHAHDGYPAFANWPTQSTMVHQQMWYKWLQRAKQGGLSAIIALTVNSEILGKALGGDPPYDDKSTADRQIDSLIEFVNRNKYFLDTVTSPARMRQVIREGKMAVIIGMEVDQIGNFYRNVPVSTVQIQDEISRLKAKGVRYIFPIHVTDNKFGGAAVYKAFFNFGNKYATGQPITSIPAELYPPVLPGNLFNVETAPDPNVTFRLEAGMLANLRAARPLLEVIEAGGFPPLPPPFFEHSMLVVKPLLDPILLTLKHSSQYQLAKRIFLDVHPEMDAYDGIVRSRTERGGHRNVWGLSPEGDFAIREMMRQGLMIDIDHASEKSVSDMLRIALENNYPLNSGHNSIRGTNASEKERTLGQLDTLKRVGGLMGIGWEEQTPTQFNTIYSTHLRLMDGKNTAFGSDIGGYATTPKAPTSAAKFINYTNPERDDFLRQYEMEGSPRVWNYNTGGMAHIGMLPDFFEALKKDGMTTERLNQLFLSAEYFAQMWEKCEQSAPLVNR